MSHTEELTRLFAAQHGVIHFAQAKAAGLHQAQIQRLAKAGVWTRVLPGVYADLASGSFEQALFAAWLWAGKEAVVSHRSAAKLMGLDGVETNLPELTVPPHRHPRSAHVVVHRAVLPQADRRLWNGLPVTSAVRTLVDLAGSASAEELAIALDCAWRRRLLRLEWLEHRVREIGTQGRRGMDALARVLRDCRFRRNPLESALEMKLWWRWPPGLPRPRPGLQYEDDFGQPGQIDFAFPRERLAIECDGFEVHGQRQCFEKDRVRLSRLAASGWRVIHVTWRQLEQPQQVFDRIAAALRQAQASALVQSASSPHAAWEIATAPAPA